MKKLTKEDILKGKSKTENLFVETYGAEVEIRPLTDGELTEVFAAIGNIPLNEKGVPDISKIDIIKNFEALRIAVSKGMTNPKLTLEEVGDMKFGAPEFIGTKILELSGIPMTGKERVKKK
ncbi:hypothetical protein BEH94_02425 [Candidatus Altiarchaeales archaeon WOR_SM1_SCG]|nr:hypothetical protein BEH94_02425 [Candidatus Altiarchaeales archaeon WOR_SM1_SCG]